MSKRYRLLKDYRGFKNDLIPSGTVLTELKEKGWFGNALVYEFEGYGNDVVLENQILNNPEWFEEIKTKRNE